MSFEKTCESVVKGEREKSKYATHAQSKYGPYRPPTLKPMTKAMSRVNQSINSSIMQVVLNKA